jgi:hypothetical protein
MIVSIVSCRLFRVDCFVSIDSCRFVLFSGAESLGMGAPTAIPPPWFLFHLFRGPIHFGSIRGSVFGSIRGLVHGTKREPDRNRAGCGVFKPDRCRSAAPTHAGQALMRRLAVPAPWYAFAAGGWRHCTRFCLARYRYDYPCDTGTITHAIPVRLPMRYRYAIPVRLPMRYRYDYPCDTGTITHAITHAITGTITAEPKRNRNGEKSRMV